jgi:hypothetical protein
MIAANETDRFTQSRDCAKVNQKLSVRKTD